MAFSFDELLAQSLPPAVDVLELNTGEEGRFYVTGTVVIEYRNADRKGEGPELISQERLTLLRDNGEHFISPGTSKFDVLMSDYLQAEPLPGVDINAMKRPVWPVIIRYLGEKKSNTGRNFKSYVFIPYKQGGKNRLIELPEDVFSLSINLK